MGKKDRDSFPVERVYFRVAGSGVSRPRAMMRERSLPAFDADVTVFRFYRGVYVMFARISFRKGKGRGKDYSNFFS